ncbi:hypothetical protein [Paenibacillus validus]|uniref:hypothetical protein n=1 Tax=Paenibacillus validus TaxID=44253 RepID=UPI003D27BB26
MLIVPHSSNFQLVAAELDIIKVGIKLGLDIEQLLAAVMTDKDSEEIKDHFK